MSLERRLARLEARQGGDDTCHQCGRGAQLVPRQPMRFVLAAPDEPPAAPCLTCGREPLVVSLRLGRERDDDADGGEGSRWDG